LRFIPIFFAHFEIRLSLTLACITCLPKPVEDHLKSPADLVDISSVADVVHIAFNTSPHILEHTLVGVGIQEVVNKLIHLPEFRHVPGLYPRIKTLDLDIIIERKVNPKGRNVKEEELLKFAGERIVVKDDGLEEG